MRSCWQLTFFGAGSLILAVGRWPLGYITGMRPLNVQKLQDKIAALSSDLSQLEVKRDQVIARRPGLAESDRPAFFRDVTVVFESTRRRSVVCT
jgi:hypothetical protein